MKKQFFLSALLLIFATSDFAQNKTIDSLKLALKLAKHDTMRSNILAQLAEIADDGEWEKYNELLKVLTEAKLKLTNPNGTEYKLYQKHFAISLHNIGFIYKNQGDINKALEYYDKSMKIQEEIGDKEEIAITYHNIGAIYNKQGHISKALEYYGKSLKIKEEINDKDGIASSFNAIGIVYKNQGDTDKALE